MNLKAKVWFGLLAAVFLGIALLAARPVYRQLKTWRADQLAAQGEMAREERRWDEAYEKGRAAFALAPQSPRVQRLLARILAAAGQERAIPFWNALLHSAHATLDDRLEAAAFALRLRRFEAAHGALAPLLVQDPVPPSALRLALSLHAEQGNRQPAIRVARRLAASAPQDLDAALTLARLLNQSTDRTQQLEGQRLLWQVGERPDRSGLAALLELAASPDLDLADAGGLARRLRSHPDADTGSRLTSVDLQLRLHPKQRRSIVEAAVREALAAGSTNSPIELGRWLNRQHEFTATLRTVSVAHARTNQDACLIHLDALAGLGQWPQVRQLLGEPALPIDPTRIALFQARAAQAMGDDRLRRLYWDQAHSLAGDDATLLFHVAQYAERAAETGEAARAYRRLTQHPQAARAGYLGLVRLAETAEDTRSLRDLLREVAARFPDDVEPRNDAAYLDLLLRENMVKAKADALELLHHHPQLLACRTTYALALLRDDQAPSAAALFRGLEIDWDGAQPGWRAVHAAVVGAGGDREAARALAARIAAARLRPEERALIQPWLAPASP